LGQASLLLAGAALIPPASAETATYSYDALGRLIRVEFNDGRSIAYWSET